MPNPKTLALNFTVYTSIYPVKFLLLPVEFPNRMLCTFCNPIYCVCRSSGPVQSQTYLSFSYASFVRCMVALIFLYSAYQNVVRCMVALIFIYSAYQNVVRCMVALIFLYSAYQNEIFDEVI